MTDTNKEEVKNVTEERLQEDLAINDEDLATELREQATKFFYWGSLWARALKAERQQKLKVQEAEATLSQEFRRHMLETEPGVRVTERMLNEYVSNHPQYTEEQQQYIKLEYIADLFNIARIAFESRGRMLTELSKRAESNKFFENETKNMENEFIRREEKKLEKREKRAKLKEIVAPSDDDDGEEEIT